ncbi:hypothetical protein FRC04_002915 [Tulasnella sp. 424]|nr:hypothetical protein FRC04_002915 [Tulasnella sp. 424]
MSRRWETAKCFPSEYVNILHNLQQAGFITYTEQPAAFLEGPVGFPNWHSWFRVDTVNSPILNTESVGEWYLYGAGTRTAARNGAAKRLLYDVGYFEKGSNDQPQEGLPAFS